MKVLVIGVARSGTSFAGELFRQNPEVTYLYEPFFGDTVLRKRQWVWRTEESREPSAERLLREVFDGCFRELERQQTAPMGSGGGYASRADELRAGMRRHPAATDPPIVVKEIRLNMQLRWVARVLGDQLRVVHVVRDPRGVAASFLWSGRGSRVSLEFFRRRMPGASKKERSAGDTLLDQWAWFEPPDEWALAPSYQRYEALLGKGKAHARLAARWSILTGHALDDAEGLPRGHYLRVRYEDLCLDPLGEARRVYGFLSRPLPASVEDWMLTHTRGGDRQERYGTSRDSAVMADVWRQQLTRRQVTEITAICSPVMERVGYTAE
jgi:hypothetical protein